MKTNKKVKNKESKNNSNKKEHVMCSINTVDFSQQYIVLFLLLKRKKEKEYVSIR